MEGYTPLRFRDHIRKINTDGVLLALEGNNLGGYKDIDLMYPYIIISLCLRGSSRVLYDMKEVRQEKNDLTLVLPGHILRPLDYSDDYSQAWLIFNPSVFAESELKFNPEDLDRIHQAPRCHLTDEQASALLSILKVIDYIKSCTEEELPHKHRLLEVQLSLAYELYLFMCHDQDKAWVNDRKGMLYLKFCDLVVTHYREEKNVNYYARLLGYEARYFSKVFRSYNNGLSPLEWIQHYVTTQAKRLMHENPKMSVKEIAFQLGFPNTANFCRYFKNATGITTKDYRDQINTVNPYQ